MFYMHGQRHTGLTNLWSLFEVRDTKSGFPTTMDGKAHCVYTLICVSPTTTDSKAQCLSLLIAALHCDCSLWTRSSHRQGKETNYPPPHFCLSISQVCPCLCGTARGLWTRSLQTCHVFCFVCLYPFQVSWAFAARFKLCIVSFV